MNIKDCLLLFASLLFCTCVFAQKQNIYYLKNNGRVVKTKDSADYIRIVSEPDSGTTLFNVKEYYALNDAIKLVGKSSKIEYNRFEGPFVSFFPSGKRKEMATYEKGVPVGNIYKYYPNGKLQSISRTATNYTTNDGYIIQSSNDTAGKAMVVNGSGHYVEYDDGVKIIIEEGDLVNTLKEGLWRNMIIDKYQNEDKNDTLFVKEQYHNGSFISGISTDKNGATYTYVQKEINPEFAGGERAFGQFLTHNIKYPYLAKQHNIQGRVYINFVVERDGHLTDIKVVREPGSGLGDEGLRVMKLSPIWVPGFQYGRPVRVSYTIPINFSMGYQ